MSSNPARSIGLAFAVAGGALVIASSLRFGALGPGLAGFIAWALVPYAILAAASRAVRDPWPIAGAGAAALVIETGIRLSVFVFPRGSTAAIALVFSPAFIAAIGLPVGAAGGWIVGRAVRSGHPSLAIAAGAAAAAALALVGVQLARPDLTPAAAFRRRQALERIGPPRVTAGATAFERRVLASTPSWRDAGRFGEEDADEVALIGSGAIDLLDAEFTPRARLQLTGGAERWTGFGRLARVHGELVVAETGGGFSDTRVHRLDGTELWRYHPDRDLPPTSMLPADLDADGETEFYAATMSAIVRLDGDGRQVWRYDARMPGLAGLSPRDGSKPGRIVAIEGQDALFLDGAGSLQGRHRLDGIIVGVVDWPDVRAIVSRGSGVRAMSPDGTVTFDWPLEDLAAAQAVTVRFAAGAQPRLAIVGAASRETHRWRLDVVTPDRVLEYQEVFDTPVRVLTVHRADGSGALLIDGPQLVALQRAGRVTAAR